MHNTEMFKDSA